MENNEDNKISNFDNAKSLIQELKNQLNTEKERFNKFRQEIYREKDFKTSKFYTYFGPSYYLDRQAVVFNIYIAPAGDTVEFYKEHIAKVFPKINSIETPFVADLFAETLMLALKMDINLFIGKYSIGKDGEEYVIAVEYLEEDMTYNTIDAVSEWYTAISNDKTFDFNAKFIQLQNDFGKTLFGGPTIYSLIEAGVKLDIPVFYLPEENQFQWGYGKKQLRGRSTTFSTDGIKDTEFTMYKDMVGEFLVMCGFPTPTGTNCFTEEDILNEAKKLGFPVVIKPVAGHKGQGVTTGIESEEEVIKAFNNIVAAAKAEGVNFDGALVQQQVYGTDHRLLSVNGKFVAALERVPAFVDGDGINNIEKLIAIENSKEIRIDNARSPLCKIKIDENLIDFLKLQNISLDYIPKENEKIILRRVANISAGGVSINVTNKIHPVNVQLVEDIASFFAVKCLGIDVLAADISKPWTEGNFGILEINAGPGVFMHLAPAYGGSVDVPQFIMQSHFPKQGSGRIPIIATNKSSKYFANLLLSKLKEIKPEVFFSSLTEEGVFFNDRFFHNNAEHDQNVKIILRNPKTEFALFTHTLDNIYDFGLFHRGADIVILDNPEFVETSTLKEQLLFDGLLIKINKNKIELLKEDILQTETYFETPQEMDDKLIDMINPYLRELLYKYE